MVVKRQCTFCAGEVEPGTGTMFVKRDGTVFVFGSSSCRQQQLHLGRVGHRLKWTRAHTLKRAAAQAGPRADRNRAVAASRPSMPTPKETAPAPKGASTPSPAPAAAPAATPSAAPSPAPVAAEAKKTEKSAKGDAEAKPAKPKAKKPKTGTPPASGA
ncbi:MAG: hypothetical protein L3K17_00860 [Thermoplasmata archaeon]|nr:hypothetical protein [Thermoplasmata archaeon]